MSGVIRFDSGATGLAAGAAVTNLLAGTFLERLGPRPEWLSVWGVVDDVAGLSGLVTVEVRLGNVIVLDRGVVPLYTARQGPNITDHRLVRAAGAAFDLCQIRLFNGAAATAAPYRFLVESAPA